MTSFSKSRGVLGALLACLIAMVAIPVAADEIDTDAPGKMPARATFELKSGEIVTDVPFDVNSRFHIVTLLGEGEERNVSFSDIVAVRAGDEDVTTTVLGRPAESVSAAAGATSAVEGIAADDSGSGDDADTGWLSKDDPTYVARNASPWRMGLRVAGNFSLPTGDYYEGLDSGLGYEADILIGLRRTYGLRLSVSRAGLTPGHELFLVNHDPVLVPENEDWSMTAWRFSIAAQVHKPLTDREGDLSLLYGYAGLGAIWQELGVDFDLVDTGDGTRTPSRLAHDETKFLTTLGGGVLKMVSPTIGIDVAAELGVVWIGTNDDVVYTYYGNTETALLIDFKVGVVKLFN